MLAYASSSCSPTGAAGRSEKLAEELPVTRPAVSQHLKVLKEAGLVIDEAAGTRRLYRLNPDGLGRLRADLDRFWSNTLRAFKLEAEQSKEEDS